MATDQRAAPNLSTPDDATLRSLIAAIQASLAAAGAVRTTDSGQLLDPSGVVGSTVAGQIYGYDIYRLSDALQATKPLFIKLEYGNATGGTRYMGLWVSVGTGTNGAGVLTGNVSTRHASSMNSATAATIFSSCAADRWGFAIIIPGTDSIQFHVHRTRDGNGALTGDGAIILSRNSQGNTTNVQAVPYTGAVPAVVVAGSHFGSMMGSGSYATGTDIALGGVPCPFSGVWRYMLAALYQSGTVANLAAFTMTFLGAAHAFMPTGVPQNWGGGVAGTCLAMPWE